MLLSLAAIVSETTKDVIQKAMESIKTKTVMKWYEKNIGKSVQSKKAIAFNLQKIVEQKQSQQLMAA